MEKIATPTRPTTMSDELTKEQEQELDELFDQLDGTDSPDQVFAILKRIFLNGKEAADAALRAQLEACEQQLKRWTYWTPDGTIEHWLQEREQKLAVCEKERDLLVKALNDEQVQADAWLEQRNAAQAEVARLEKHIYNTLEPLIPYIELPSESPAYYRVQEAARIVKHLESRTARLRSVAESLAQRYSDCALRVGDYDSESDTWPVYMHVGGLHNECNGAIAEFYNEKSAHWFVGCIKQAQQALAEEK